MVPVKGLFAPIEVRLDDGARVPVSNPGAMTSLFPSLKGEVLGSTSSLRISEVKPRPPKC